MLRRTVSATITEHPWRPPRILIEDPALLDAPIPRAVRDAFDVTICSGPDGGREICPLVVDGCCPAGPVDVVVSALDSEWAPSVRAAWRRTGTPLVEVDDAPELPAARLAHHMGAAVHCIQARLREDALLID
jgi:hypothetical protein